MKVLANKLAIGLAVLASASACGSSSVNESKTYLANGNKFHGQKQWEMALGEYEKAIQAYHDNHLAWFGKGVTYYEKKEYGKAAEALQVAVQLAPDSPVYQLVYGVDLYEKTLDDARKLGATKQGIKPEDVTINTASLSYDEALNHLREASRLNGDMWRAHLFLGKIYRDTERPKEAAEEFTKTLSTNPRESTAYVALAELYLKWDYADKAIKVGQQGVANVCPTGDVCAESSDVWYVLGMGYDDKRQDKEAIDAFTKAIEAKRDNHKAKFQRGVAYNRSGDTIGAKKDLDEYSKTAGASADFNVQLAKQIVQTIVAKEREKEAKDKAGTGAGGGIKSPEDVVKSAKGAKGGPPPRTK